MTGMRWDVARESTVLIVVDMQNGFLRPDGFSPRVASTGGAAQRRSRPPPA
jgi:nicotinamidase-related amidase